MQVVLYTEKTVAQALTALNARMQAKATSTRPAMDGWVEKSGRFSIGVTTEVVGQFTRTTFLHGQLERTGSYTTIKGRVSAGATKEHKILIYGALAVVALVLMGSGSPWMSVVLLPFAAMLYIPLTGDHTNSELLILELQKILKAKTSPPKAAAKSTTAKAPAKRSTSTHRPAEAKPSAAAPARKRPAAAETEDDEDDAAPEIMRLPLEEEA